MWRAYFTPPSGWHKGRTADGMCVRWVEKTTTQKYYYLIYQEEISSDWNSELVAAAHSPFRLAAADDEKKCNTFLPSSVADAGNMAVWFVMYERRLAAPEDLMTHTMCRMNPDCVYMTTEERRWKSEESMRDNLLEMPKDDEARK